MGAPPWFQLLSFCPLFEIAEQDEDDNQTLGQLVFLSSIWDWGWAILNRGSFLRVVSVLYLRLTFSNVVVEGGGYGVSVLYLRLSCDTPPKANRNLATFLSSIWDCSWGAPPASPLPNPTFLSSIWDCLELADRIREVNELGFCPLFEIDKAGKRSKLLTETKVSVLYLRLPVSRIVNPVGATSILAPTSALPYSFTYS